MNIGEIIMENNNKGTYAAMRFSLASALALQKFCQKFKVPNCLKLADYHSTLLYSRNYLPDYTPAGRLDPPMIALPKNLEIWESPANAFKKEATNCLVLRINCPELVDRFEYLMNNHDATYDYDEYKPHVTLSYDVGDFSLDGIDCCKEIPELELVVEYSETLDLDKTFDTE